MEDRIVRQGITFDDVLLEPQYSEVVPSEVDVSTQLTERITRNIPLISSPMDTVPEPLMALALAQHGGLGVIHKIMSIEAQTEEVDMVKRSANGIISDPVTLTGDLPINPSGGVLCSNPIGASGMLRFAEAALQVRGMAGAHQVDGARLALGHAYGGGSQFFSMWIVGSERP